jgi:hypothetical protein
MRRFFFGFGLVLFCAFLAGLAWGEGQDASISFSFKAEKPAYRISDRIRLVLEVSGVGSVNSFVIKKAGQPECENLRVETVSMTESRRVTAGGGVPRQTCRCVYSMRAISPGPARVSHLKVDYLKEGEEGTRTWESDPVELEILPLAIWSRINVKKLFLPAVAVAAIVLTFFAVRGFQKKVRRAEAGARADRPPGPEDAVAGLQALRKEGDMDAFVVSAGRLIREILKEKFRVKTDAAGGSLSEIERELDESDVKIEGLKRALMLLHGAKFARTRLGDDDSDAVLGLLKRLIQHPGRSAGTGES